MLSVYSDETTQGGKMIEWVFYVDCSKELYEHTKRLYIGLFDDGQSTTMKLHDWDGDWIKYILMKIQKKTEKQKKPLGK